MNLCRSVPGTQCGFTLIEVALALAVIALALGAVVTTASHYARNVQYLEERTMAHWVGLNVFAEMENTRSWPVPARDIGEREMAGREWAWTATIRETADVSLHHANIEVAFADSPDRVISRVTGFLRQRNGTPD